MVMLKKSSEKKGTLALYNKYSEKNIWNRGSQHWQHLCQALVLSTKECALVILILISEVKTGFVHRRWFISLQNSTICKVLFIFISRYAGVVGTDMAITAHCIRGSTGISANIMHAFLESGENEYFQLN